MIQKTIHLSISDIPYTLRLSRRSRRLRLTVYPGGILVVSAPAGASLRAIEKFMTAKAPWILTKVGHLKKVPPRPSVKASKQNFEKYKTAALILAQSRVKYFNALYGFKVGKISIKNQKSRLGSCSRQGNLNFNYKIALMRPEHSDYIIVHELCYLSQFNHSQKFWEMVAQNIPNYREIRRQLKYA